MTEFTSFLLKHGFDVTEADTIQIVIDTTGSILWINIDGECYVRATKTRSITIDDNRPGPHNRHHLARPDTD